MPTRVDGAVRRLAAVWFADIVGYTRLSAQDESAALRLVSILQNSAREEIAAYGGRLVKLIGDAVLAEFNSTDAAVRSALGLQTRFAADSSAAGIEAKLRVGVHVGDVLGTPDGDIYGDGVNTASRVQGQAGPGQVCVTQDIWHQLRQRREFHFASTGERKLKGLTGSVWLFTVRLSAPEETGAPEKPALPVNRSIRWARLVRVALAYIVASAVFLQVTALLRSRLQLPDWVTPAGFVLLLIGLVVMAATAWVQSRPTWERRVGEVTDPWRVDVEDLATSVALKRLPTLTWGRALLGGVLAFGVLFGAAGVYVLLKDGIPAPGFAPRPAQAQPGLGLAILPFDASGTEPSLWEEGMVDLLALNLDGAAGVRVIDPRSVLSRWRDQGEVPDSATAIRLARQVGARYALAGRTEASADRLAIVAEVYDTETGEVLGRASVEGPPDSLPRLIDEFGLQVLRAGVASAGTEDLPALDLGRLATSSLPALRAYLAGAQEFRRSRWSEAQSSFRAAIESDSTFAQALYRMSLSESWSAQPHAPRRDGFSDAASRFTDRLPEREALLVQAYDQLNRGSPGAIATLEDLTTRYPDDVEGWFLLGDAYYHLGGRDGRFRDALHEALRLDPSFGPAYLHLIEDAVERDETADAQRLIASYRAVDPSSPLLSTLALLLERDRPEPAPAEAGAPASSPAPVDPARSAYESSRQGADVARSAAAAEGATTNQPAFARGDSLRQAALADASSGRWSPARQGMDAAKVAYDDARTSAVWQSRIDSARLALEPLRAAASLPAVEASEVQGIIRQATDAEGAGRYEEALRHLRLAAERYRSAPPPPAQVERPDPAPVEAAPPAEAPPRPTVRADEVAADVLEELRRAIESKNLDALRDVWASLTAAEARNFEASFALMRDLSVGFETLAVESAGDRITVRTRTTYEFFNESSRRADRQDFTQTLQLALQGGRWVIVASGGG